jgi:very-short-patch-repair endonuclease
LTAAEQRLWRCLRKGQVDGFEFRRQYPAGPFIVDFYCPAARLVIEVDGDLHTGNENVDAARTEWLETHKHWRVIRFKNQEVLEQQDAVLEKVRQALREQLTPPP